MTLELCKELFVPLEYLLADKVTAQTVPEQLSALNAANVCVDAR